MTDDDIEELVERVLDNATNGNLVDAAEILLSVQGPDLVVLTAHVVSTITYQQVRPVHAAVDQLERLMRAYERSQM